MQYDNQMLGGWKYSVTVMLWIIYASNPQAHLSSGTHRILSYCLSGKCTSRQLGDSAMMGCQVLNHQQHFEACRALALSLLQTHHGARLCACPEQGKAIKELLM